MNARPIEDAPATMPRSPPNSRPSSSAGRGRAVQAADAKLVGDLVAGLPFATFHLVQWMSCAVVFAASGSIDALNPWLIQSMRAQLPLDPSQEGLLTSILYWGLSLGTLVAGVVADRLGRRATACGGLAVLILLQIGVGQLSTFWPVAACLFLRGLANILTVAKTQLAECLPARRRGLLLNLVHPVWQLGAFAGTAYTFRTSDYHRLTLISSFLPAASLSFALLASIESPMWLLQAWGREAAERSLRAIARACNAPALPTPLFSVAHGDVEMHGLCGRGRGESSAEGSLGGSRRLSGAAGKHAPPSRDGSSDGQLDWQAARQQRPPRSFADPPPSTCVHTCSPVAAEKCWALVERRSVRGLFLGVSAVWVVFAYASLSTDFLLIRFLERTGRSELQRPLRFSQFGAKLVGGIAGAAAVDFGRKRVLALCFVITALGSFSLSAAQSTAQLYASVILFHSANEVLWATLMTFSVEAFPTELRASAVGVCSALSGISASVSIGLGPTLMEGGGGPALPFAINALVLLLGLGLCLRVLPGETSGMALR